METIKVNVEWEGENYSCGWGFPGFGAVICTNKSLESVKTDFEDAVKEQVASMVADGEPLPAWLASGDYAIEYLPTAGAIVNNS